MCLRKAEQSVLLRVAQSAAIIMDLVWRCVASGLSFYERV